MSVKPLTEHLPAGPGESLDLAAYEAVGGYQAARKALTEMSPGDVIAEVERARLRGRGGAGFPTAAKWRAVPTSGAGARRPVHIAVNADEMEPGTFKDRLLLERSPHQLIEGVLCCARAVGATRAVIFLRQEYHEAARLIAKAIAEARERGYLGPDVMGSGLELELALHLSAGRYICGEETALLTALEGKRAIPRAKPPYPPVVGLWGKPTVVQNVETLCCVPHIVARGADWFLGLSRGGDGGTKLYGASGWVKRPGLWELPLGTTLGELLEEHAGGMAEGRALRGALPGGASTDFLTPAHLDVPLDFEQPQKAGSRLGTGTALVLDDRTCPVGLVRNLIRFFALESCGFCTPCREGLPWIDRILADLEAGRGRPGDLEILEEQARRLGPGLTFCALAPGAMAPLQSALVHFRDDFERHLTAGRCPFTRGEARP